MQKEEDFESWKGKRAFGVSGIKRNGSMIASKSTSLATGGVALQSFRAIRSSRLILSTLDAREQPG